MTESIMNRRTMLRAGAAGIGALAATSGIARALDGIDAVSGGASATAPAVRLDPPAKISGGFDPDVRYVGIYGFPGSRILGILGTLSVQGAIDKARAMANQFAPFERPVVPILEILGSVAAADAGGDGNYSNEFGVATFTPHLDAAYANDMQVIFDLQTGRSTFFDQAREYEDLWRYPNAHVALDPEWRFDAPGRPGGGRIGTVGASEVNATIDYLDGVIRTYGLPPKMLIIHQFVPSMVTDKQSIRGTENVHVIMHMDGFGRLATKRGSYARMVADLPPGSTTGWKNFFDADRPTPTPAQTLDVFPKPILVTYQ